jgi:hypothetical protein
LPDRARLQAIAADMRSLARDLGLDDRLTLRDVLELASDAPSTFDRDDCPMLMALLREAVCTMAKGCLEVVKMRMTFSSTSVLANP